MTFFPDVPPHAAQFARGDLFFEDVISAALSDDRRVDRHWLVERLETAVSGSPQPSVGQIANRFLLLTAEAGAGKTDVVAVLARRHPEWLRYFLRRDQTHRAGSPGARAFLCHIGLQLAATDPQVFAFGAEIHVEQTVGVVTAQGAVTGVEVDRLVASPFGRAALHVAQNVERVEGGLAALKVREVVADHVLLPVEGLAEMALLRPARALYQQNPERQLVVLLDALDELRSEKSDDHLLLWLASLTDIPPNLVFVIASRSDEALLWPLRDRHQDSISEIRLHRADPDLQTHLDRDLTAYTLQLAALPQVGDALTAQGIETETWVKSVVAKADGNLGYLVALGRSVDASITRPLSAESSERFASLLNLQELPIGLSALYGFFLRRAYSAVEGQSVRLEDEATGETLMASLWPEVFDRILGVLCAAQAPLTAVQIRQLGDIRASQAQVQEALSELSAFLRELDGRWQYFHLSFQEFLTASATRLQPETTLFAQDLADCHRKVATVLLKSVGLPLSTEFMPQSGTPEGERSSVHWQALDAFESYGWEHLISHLTLADKPPPPELSGRVPFQAAPGQSAEGGGSGALDEFRWRRLKQITQADFFVQRRQRYGGSAALYRTDWNEDWERVLEAGQGALDFGGVIECGLRRSELQESHLFGAGVQTLIIEAIILARGRQDDALQRWLKAAEQQTDNFRKVYLKTHLLGVLSRYWPSHTLCAKLASELPELLFALPPSGARDGLWHHFGQAVYPRSQRSNRTLPTQSLTNRKGWRAVFSMSWFLTLCARLSKPSPSSPRAQETTSEKASAIDGLPAPQTVLEQLTTPLARIGWLCHWAQAGEGLARQPVGLLQQALTECDALNDAPDVQGAFLSLAFGDAVLNQDGGTVEALAKVVEAVELLCAARSLDVRETDALLKSVHARYNLYYRAQQGASLPLQWGMQEARAFKSLGQKPNLVLESLLDSFERFEPPSPDDKDEPRNIWQAMRGLDIEVVEELQGLIKLAPLIATDSAARKRWAECVQRRWLWVEASYKVSWLARDLALCLQVSVPDDGEILRPGFLPSGPLSPGDFALLQECLRPLAEQIVLKWAAFRDRQEDDEDAEDDAEDMEEIRQANREGAYKLEIKIAAWLAVVFLHLDDEPRSQEMMRFVREYVPRLNWTPHNWREVVQERVETLNAIIEAACWCGQRPASAELQNDAARTKQDDFEIVFTWLQEFLPRALSPHTAVDVCHEALASAGRLSDVASSRRAFDRAVTLGRTVLAHPAYTALALLQMGEVYALLWRSTAALEHKQRSVALTEEGLALLRQLQPTRTVPTTMLAEAFCSAAQNFLGVAAFDQTRVVWAEVGRIIRNLPYVNLQAELIQKLLDLVTHLYALYPDAIPDATKEQTPEFVSARALGREMVASLLEEALSIEAGEHTLKAGTLVANTAVRLDETLRSLVPVKRFMRHFRQQLKQEQDGDISQQKSILVEAVVESHGVDAMLEMIPVLLLTGCARTARRSYAHVEELVLQGCRQTRAQGRGAGLAAQRAARCVSTRSLLLRVLWGAQNVDPSLRVWPDEGARALQAEASTLLQAPLAPEDGCQVQIALATFAFEFDEGATGLGHLESALTPWHHIALDRNRERPFEAILVFWSHLESLEQRLRLLPQLQKALWHLSDNIKRETAEARLALAFLDSPSHYETLVRPVVSLWALHPVMSRLDVLAGDRDKVRLSWLLELIAKVSREQPSLFAGVALQMTQAAVRSQQVTPETAHSTVTRLEPYLRRPMGDLQGGGMFDF